MLYLIGFVLKWSAIYICGVCVGGMIKGSFPLGTTLPSLLLPALMWGLGMYAEARHGSRPPVLIKTPKQRTIAWIIAIVMSLYAGFTTT